MARRGLKICCMTTAVFLAILIIIIVTLGLTIFKLRDPQITAHPFGLGSIGFNNTLTVLMTIDNPNYGSFEYKNATSYVTYHGSTVAEVPIPHHKVPARAKVDMTTSTDLMANKVTLNPRFWDDIASGHLNFTSTATLPGKVNVAKFFKFPATAYCTCYFSFHIQSQAVDSKCNSRIKL